jgi:hypothetical protein
MRFWLLLLLPLLTGCPSDDDDSTDDDDVGDDDAGDDDAGDDDAGDDDTGDDPCDFAACGGDLTGTWDYVSSCPTGAPPQSPFPDCEGGTYDVVFTVSGWMSFEAGGAWSQELTRQADYHAVLTAACIASEGLGTCADIHANLFSSVGTCDDDGAAGCLCTGPFLAEQVIPGTGTWSSSGDRWSVSLDGGPTIDGDFCVSGDTMKSVADGVEAISTLTRQ